MKSMFTTLIVGMVVLTVGCAVTKDQFMNMSPPERQAEVCYEATVFKQRKEQLSFYDHAIRDKQALLNRGYRVHKSCQTVTVPLPAKDCSGMDRFAAAYCSAEPTTTQDNRCVETPVAIDPEFEKKELENLRVASRNLRVLHTSRTHSCFIRVAEMSSDAAYVYYSERMEPQAATAPSNAAGTPRAARSPQQSATATSPSPTLCWRPSQTQKCGRIR